jgi:hypothetical protein
MWIPGQPATCRRFDEDLVLSYGPKKEELSLPVAPDIVIFSFEAHHKLIPVKGSIFDQPAEAFPVAGYALPSRPDLQSEMTSPAINDDCEEIRMGIHLCRNIVEGEAESGNIMDRAGEKSSAIGNIGSHIRQFHSYMPSFFHNDPPSGLFGFAFDPSVEFLLSVIIHGGNELGSRSLYGFSLSSSNPCASFFCLV